MSRIKHTFIALMVVNFLACSKPLGPINTTHFQMNSERKPSPYMEEGIASWYGGDGDGFAGLLTANGEVYDPDQMTCAHKILPLGTLLKVTNLDNGRSIIVRVNDRGPYVDGRIIDLSRRAASLLDIKIKGTARVRIVSSDTSGRPQPMSTLDANNPFTVQLIATENKKDLEALQQSLDKSYKGSYIEEYIDRNLKLVYRLRIGLFRDRESAESLAKDLKRMFRTRGINPYVTRKR
ncbi:MAG: septal ring lytic transglycosylase RlpA family protein [Holophagaceae bacterium]|mgnify:CR=1 FL=1|jgi:rare lipoprotein A